MIEFDIALQRGGFALQADLLLEQTVVGLFGPSGSGKSTLLGILAGTIKPDRGRILLNGRCLLDSTRGIDLPIHRRRVGVVFQDSRLFPHLSVRRNLEYGFNLLAQADRKFGLEQITELLELTPLLQQRPHRLSGGEQQRVALGRALLASPELLLLDEPMAALDQRLKAQILPFLRRVREQIQVPMIYVSHSINEILDLTQHIIVIDNGAILAHGDFHQVMGTDRVLALASSLGLDNTLQVTLLERHEDLGYCLGKCGHDTLLLPYSELMPGSRFSVAVPAAQIALSRTPVAGISIQNQLAGTVSAMQIVNHRALVTVACGGMMQSLICEVTAKALHDLQLKINDPVYCLLKAQAIRYLGSAEP